MNESAWGNINAAAQPAPGVVFIPVRPAGPKIRYGVVWRRGLVGEVVPRFIEYTKEQFQLTPGRNDRQ